jgi:hypothetical protein
MADRCECAFDDVRCAQMLSVVVESEQNVAILDEAFEPIIVLTPQVSTKASKAEGASFLVSAI